MLSGMQTACLTQHQLCPSVLQWLEEEVANPAPASRPRQTVFFLCRLVKKKKKKKVLLGRHCLVISWTLKK